MTSECEDHTIFDKKCNNLNLQKEKLEWESALQDSASTDTSKNYIYPNLNDPDFNVKIDKRCRRILKYVK
jgi:hypothetical protein